MVSPSETHCTIPNVVASDGRQARASIVAVGVGEGVIVLVGDGVALKVGLGEDVGVWVGVRVYTAAPIRVGISTDVSCIVGVDDDFIRLARWLHPDMLINDIRLTIKYANPNLIFNSFLFRLILF